MFSILNRSCFHQLTRILQMFKSNSDVLINAINICAYGELSSKNEIFEYSIIRHFLGRLSVEIKRMKWYIYFLFFFFFQLEYDVSFKTFRVKTFILKWYCGVLRIIIRNYFRARRSTFAKDDDKWRSGNFAVHQLSYFV